MRGTHTMTDAQIMALVMEKARWQEYRRLYRAFRVEQLKAEREIRRIEKRLAQLEEGFPPLYEL